MITVDFIGLFFTACLVGIRYPACVLLAIVAQEAGRILIALFFQGQIDNILVSGVFSATSVSQLPSSVKLCLVSFGGPLANYVICAAIGGVEWEKTRDLLNPFSMLRHPVAVINLRFAVASFIVSVLRLL